jgi:hypothetical protein
MGKSSDTGLEWLARHTGSDTFFVSHALAQYKVTHRVDDEHLSRLLACSRRALDRLALCRLPDDRDATFRERVQQIATFVSCNADRLLGVLREVAAFDSLREQSDHASSSGLLMAARDRKARETSHPSKPGKSKRQRR